MPTHLAAYTSADLQTANGVLGAITDDLFYGTGISGFMLSEDMAFIAGYACGESLDFASIVAPSLLRVGYPAIVPTQRNPAGLFTPFDPGMMDLLRNAIRLRRGERITANGGERTGMTNYPGVVLMWLQTTYEPIPEGESFWLPYSFAAGQQVNALQWSALTPGFVQSLPSGRYMVAGIEHYSPQAIAVRVACSGSSFRPGALALGDPTGLGGGRNHQLFYGDYMGSYGVFSTDAPPTLQILSATSRVTDDSDTGFMRVVRLSDGAFGGQ